MSHYLASQLMQEHLRSLFKQAQGKPAKITTLVQLSEKITSRLTITGVVDAKDAITEKHIYVEGVPYLLANIIEFSYQDGDRVITISN